MQEWSSVCRIFALCMQAVLNSESALVWPATGSEEHFKLRNSMSETDSCIQLQLLLLAGACLSGPLEIIQPLRLKMMKRPTEINT